MTNYNMIFRQFPEIETERLKLRAFQESDILDYYKMCLAEDYIELFCHNGTYVSEMDAYNTIMFKYPQSFDEQLDLTWAITLKENGILIGIRDLFIDSPTSPIETQGYIKAEHRNKGYNQEIINAIITFLRKTDADSLEFSCYSSNHPVIYIADKLDFTEITPFQMKMRGKNKYSFNLNK